MFGFTVKVEPDVTTILVEFCWFGGPGLYDCRTHAPLGAFVV